MDFSSSPARHVKLHPLRGSKGVCLCAHIKETGTHLHARHEEVFTPTWERGHCIHTKQPLQVAKVTNETLASTYSNAIRIMYASEQFHRRVLEASRFGFRLRARWYGRQPARLARGKKFTNSRNDWVNLPVCSIKPLAREKAKIKNEELRGYSHC